MLSRRSYSTTPSLLKTPLYKLHESLGADFVDFAGYAMPILYKGQSHIESHHWTRNKAGLFDVSHMLQQKLKGPDSIKLLEKVTPTDFKILGQWKNQLSVLLNEEGGIVDDTIITKLENDDSFYVVTNAGTREKDLKFFKEQGEGLDIKFETVDNSLLAIQGPEAVNVLQAFTKDDLSKVYFGNSTYITLPAFNNTEVHISRGGYTGEDGFEISIPNAISLELTQALLENEALKPIGLAARDSLRLEAGMCLYGHDLSDNITPVEGSLSWVISKSRRAQGGFNGDSNILAQLKDRSLVKQQRIGFKLSGPAAREGMEIFSIENPEQKIGFVTSGSNSPSLGNGRTNIGQGYVQRGFQKSGTKVLIKIRNKLREAEITKQPFIVPKFYREP